MGKKFPETCWADWNINKLLLLHLVGLPHYLYFPVINSPFLNLHSSFYYRRYRKCKVTKTFLVTAKLEHEFLKPRSFVHGVKLHFRSLSRLSLFWMRTAAQPELCREPLDWRQHAVEMSAKGNRRKGGLNLFSFHLFNHKTLLYCTSTDVSISSFRKNDGTSQTMRVFLLSSYRVLYLGHTLHLYGMIRRVLQGSFGTYNNIISPIQGN